MKIFIVGEYDPRRMEPGAKWVCDRFAEEWITYNPDIVTKNILDGVVTYEEAEDYDAIWILAGFRWNILPEDLLQSKKVVLTVHHIVPEKFDSDKRNDFKHRDQFVDVYHVPCDKTKALVEQLTDKPIEVIPFWANQNLWYPKSDKESLRKSLGIPADCFLIGSFQRDTEGSDLISPKLEKGPDIFCDIVENIFLSNKKIRVLLAGFRRQYVINRLEKAGIPFTYFEMVDFEKLNNLYNCLDLYLVTSRYEGGPQSIVECALTKTPIISTDVGLAKHILSEKSVMGTGEAALNASPDIDHAFKKVQEHTIPSGFDKFNEMFRKLIERKDKK